MNTRNKLFFLTLITLLAVSSFAAYASVAAAGNNLDFTTSIASSSRTVNEASTFTFTITNVGSSEIGGVNITVPALFLKIENPAISQQPQSLSWRIAYTAPKGNALGVISLVNQTNTGLAPEQSVKFTFNSVNPQVAGDYGWSAKATATNGETATVNTKNTIIISSILPALSILGIAAGIALINSGVNRVLINYFIGWEQYRVMQKEMAEFRNEQMTAARANDKKQMEKLKKKQSQINNMQAKMFKPQMLQIGISFIYLIVWFLVLIPTFQNTSMAYLPGYGPIPVGWFYPILSLFLGLIASRLIGIMPIDNTQ
jgi:uncharacterized membrane protein (DUF106 family)